MRTSSLFTTLDKGLQEIFELGLLRKPIEACGLLLDSPWRKVDGSLSWIKELPNRSLQPASYSVDMGDVRIVLDRLEDVEDVAVWHTHPSGLIGPSRGDMKNRPSEELKMVVVALTEDGPIPTWF